MILSELIIRDCIAIVDRQTNYETGGEILTLRRGDEDGETLTVPFQSKKEIATPMLVLRALLQDARTYEQNDFSMWCSELCFDSDDDEVKEKYEKVREITDQFHTFLDEAYDEYQEGYNAQQETQNRLYGCDPYRYYPINEINAWARSNGLIERKVQPGHEWLKDVEGPIDHYFVFYNDKSPAFTLRRHPDYDGKIAINAPYRLTYIDPSIRQNWQSDMERLPHYEI